MKVIVVGNSSCLLKQENGKLIDSFDKIVRMNKFKIYGFEKFTGIRTHIYCSKWIDIHHHINNTFEQIWLPYPQPPKWWTCKVPQKLLTHQHHNTNIEKYNIDSNKVKFLNSNFALLLEKYLNNACQPTAGLVCIMLALQEFPDCKLFYTGFSSLQGGWYWDDTHDCVKNMHSPLLEEFAIKQLKKTYNIIQI